MDIIKKQSPNYNERQNGALPRYLVLHYTGVSAEEADKVYMDSKGELSPHYMVDIDGSITQYVDEGSRAWHAGKSYWEGETDINSMSVGIEIVNGGHYKGFPEFPVQQIAAVIDLCKQIIHRNQIKPVDVIGHSDVAVGRRFDPGQVFPWEYLAEQGVGFWPDPADEDFEADVDVLLGLKKIGYDVDRCENVVLVREFQRRYEPEQFHNGLEGQVSQRTHALIACLLRQKQL